MYYGIYKEIRDSAWKCLLDFEIDRIPVDVIKITHAAGIKVIKDSDIHDLTPTENAKTYYNGIKWYIIFNDQNPIEVSRFAIAHELGHIFLGHHIKLIKYGEHKEFDKKPKSEQQADAFALRLLCPACVLWSLNISTAEDIATCCKVPLNIAEQREKRMRELYKRNKFLTSPLEKEVYKQFENSIKPPTL